MSPRQTFIPSGIFKAAAVAAVLWAPGKAEARDLPLRSQNPWRLSRRDLSRFHPNRITADVDRGIARHVLSL